MHVVRHLREGLPGGEHRDGRRPAGLEPPVRTLLRVHPPLPGRGDPGRKGYRREATLPEPVGRHRRTGAPTMKTVIYYFTGTGNSLAAARKVAAALGETELVPIASLAITPGTITPDADRVGI